MEICLNTVPYYFHMQIQKKIWVRKLQFYRRRKSLIMRNNLFDSIWVDGYTKGYIMIALKVTLELCGEQKILEKYPEITQEMVTELSTIIGDKEKEKRYYHKYEHILRELPQFKDVEKRAWRKLEREKMEKLK